MADRKEKKQRLEQMRKERQEKERIRKLKESMTEEPRKGGSLREETDELLKDLGILPAGESPSATPPVFQKASPAPEGSPAPVPVMQITSRQKAKLSVVKVGETNIPPRENLSYSKETQTIIAEPLDKEGKFFFVFIVIADSM